MSFSEPKWRERVETTEDSRARAKRAAGQRKLQRSLKRCDALNTNRLLSIEKQHDLKMAYQSQVAYRSTQNMLDKFRETFGVSSNLDKHQRLSDKGFQIRMYTKVDRDCWANDQLREWYNEKKPQGFVSANQALDSGASSFVVSNPADSEDKKSHYMLQCGGPHDPSGFLKNVPGMAPGSLSDNSSSKQVNAGGYLPKKVLPKTKLEMNPPHWRHWQKNLDHAAQLISEKKELGLIQSAPPEPWATGY